MLGTVDVVAKNMTIASESLFGEITGKRMTKNVVGPK